MTLEIFRLTNNRVRKYVTSRINLIPLDGSKEVVIRRHKDGRSDKQRRLGGKWYSEIAKQTYQGTKEVERYCKLKFGISILIRDRAGFEELWEPRAESLSYENQLEAMDILKVTSLLSVKQNAEYLRSIQEHFERNGVRLSTTDDYYYASMGYERR